MSTSKKRNEKEVRPEVAKYPIFKTGAEGFMEVVLDNLQGEILTAQDLERIRIPTGGNLNWALPSLDGEINAKEFEGIILHQQLNRAYWKSGIANGQTPPNCQSLDGKTGQGDPGGDCDECPLSKFGSAKGKSNRQACRQAKQVFLLRPESYLPVVLVLPPSSLKPFKHFMLKLSSNNVSSSQMIVRFGLEKATNRSQIAYSLASFAVKDQLSEEDAAMIKSYADALNEQGTFSQIGFVGADFNGNGNGEGE